MLTAFNFSVRSPCWSNLTTRPAPDLKAPECTAAGSVSLPSLAHSVQVMQPHSPQLACCYWDRKSAIIPKRHSYKKDSYFLVQVVLFFSSLACSRVFDGARRVRSYFQNWRFDFPRFRRAGFTRRKKRLGGVTLRG